MIGMQKTKRDLFGGTLRGAGLAALAMTASASAAILPDPGTQTHIWAWDASYSPEFDSYGSLTFPSTVSYSGGGLDMNAYSGATLVGMNTTVSDTAAWTFTWASVLQYFSVASTQDILVEWDLAGWDDYVTSIVRVYEIGFGDLLFETSASVPGSMILTLTPGTEYAFLGTMVGVHGDGGDGYGFARLSSAPVPGDTNNDGVVDADDFLEVLSNWGPCPLPCPPTCAADVTGDCDVNADDFLAVLSNWTP